MTNGSQTYEAATALRKPTGSYLEVPAPRCLDVFALLLGAAAIGDVQRHLGLAASCVTEVRHRRERSPELAAIAGGVEKHRNVQRTIPENVPWMNYQWLRD